MSKSSILAETKIWTYIKTKHIKYLSVNSFQWAEYIFQLNQRPWRTQTHLQASSYFFSAKRCCQEEMRPGEMVKRPVCMRPYVRYTMKSEYKTNSSLKDTCLHPALLPNPQKLHPHNEICHYEHKICLGQIPVKKNKKIKNACIHFYKYSHKTYTGTHFISNVFRRF